MRWTRPGPLWRPMKRRAVVTSRRKPGKFARQCCPAQPLSARPNRHDGPAIRQFHRPPALSRSRLSREITAFLPSEAEISRIWNPPGPADLASEQSFAHGCHLAPSSAESGIACVLPWPDGRPLPCARRSGSGSSIPPVPATLMRGVYRGLVRGATLPECAAMGTVSASYVVEACGALETVRRRTATRSAPQGGSCPRSRNRCLKHLTHTAAPAGRRLGARPHLRNVHADWRHPSHHARHAHAIAASEDSLSRPAARMPIAFSRGNGRRPWKTMATSPFLQPHASGPEIIAGCRRFPLRKGHSARAVDLAARYQSPGNDAIGALSHAKASGRPVHPRQPVGECLIQ